MTLVEAESPSRISRDGRTLSAFQAQRLELMSRLRKMVIDGCSPFDIQNVLGISKRQYYRLYDKACAQERTTLVNHNEHDTIRTMILVKARLEELYKINMEMAKNTNIDPRHRIKVSTLAGQLSIAIAKIDNEGMLVLARVTNRALVKQVMPMNLTSSTKQHPSNGEAQGVAAQLNDDLDDEEDDDEEEVEDG